MVYVETSQHKSVHLEVRVTTTDLEFQTQFDYIVSFTDPADNRNFSLTADQVGDLKVALEAAPALLSKVLGQLERRTVM